MSNVSLVWATPDGERLIAYMARVSNPENQDNPESSKLIRYLIKNKHWSPLEMVNVCVEINTTRDIARQILRHRSFSFQEFSQRYAEALGFERSEVRLQDHKNRQNSIHTTDANLRNWWDAVQDRMMIDTQAYYQTALAKGVAKEVARKILPEGLTMSKMYMNGTLRSWVHFLQIRCDSATQKEHRDIAMQCGDIIRNEFPNVMEALIE